MGTRTYSCEEPSGQEGELITRLQLSDDETFVYSWEWCTYAWHIVKEAKGRWEETGTTLSLHVEESEIHGISPPVTMTAVQRDGDYHFANGRILTPPVDEGQRHEALLEQQKFERSLNIKPSKLVK